MTGFVKTGGIIPSQTMSVITQKMTYEAFLERLEDQNVCVLSLHNARSWYEEVPANVMEAYLKNRDHRKPGALLHNDALSYALAGIKVR